jgi:hypothetical protein
MAPPRWDISAMRTNFGSSLPSTSGIGSVVAHNTRNRRAQATFDGLRPSVLEKSHTLQAWQKGRRPRNFDKILSSNHFFLSSTHAPESLDLFKVVASLLPIFLCVRLLQSSRVSTMFSDLSESVSMSIAVLTGANRTWYANQCMWGYPNAPCHREKLPKWLLFSLPSVCERIVRATVRRICSHCQWYGEVGERGRCSPHAHIYRLDELATGDHPEY